MSVPLILIMPPVMGNKPLMQASKRLLPDPLRPVTTANSPEPTTSDTSRKMAVPSSPQAFKPDTSRAFIVFLTLWKQDGLNPVAEHRAEGDRSNDFQRVADDEGQQSHSEST